MRNSTFPIAIDRLSHEGRGIGIHAGRTTFVSGALPGETVEARSLRRRAGIEEAMVERVLDPSPRRVVPPCEYADICGGCSLQHMAPADQIAHKESVLIEQLTHQVGSAPRHVLEPLRGPTLGYRSKARLGVRYVEKKGGVLVGFREKGGRHLTDMTRCVVLDPRVGECIGALRALLNTLSVSGQVPQLELAASGSRVALIMRHMAPLHGTDRERLREFAAQAGFEIGLQAGGPDRIEWLEEVPPPLSYRIDGIVFEFLPADFTQVNTAINAAMVERVIEQLEPESGDRILDLFCGIGNFTLPIARRAGQVIGYEGDAALVSRALANARANGISNVAFEAADLASGTTRLPLIGFDKIVLDPPRTGAEALLTTHDFSPIERVIYVSCNPGTLARDAALLVHRHGFTLSAAGVMDMFPHTAHVESLAVFVRVHGARQR